VGTHVRNAENIDAGRRRDRESGLGELIKLVSSAEQDHAEAALNRRVAQFRLMRRPVARAWRNALPSCGRLDEIDELVNVLISRVNTFDAVGPRGEAVTSS
jgi:hypothetical protein